MDDTSLATFTSGEFGTLRAVKDDAGEPWFVAKDVCDVLGTDTRDVRKILDQDEVSTLSEAEANVDSRDIGPEQGGRSPLIVSEPGLYKLIMRSRKPEAKAFQRWVTHDVLPALRRDGAYVASDGTEDDATLMARALLAAKRQMDAKDARIARLEDTNERMRPMAQFAVTSLTSEGTLTVTEAARQLKQADPSIGRSRLFGLLRADGMLCKRSNQATVEAIERGYLRNVQTSYVASDGQRRLREPYAVVTPKGLGWMTSRYAREAVA
jgi:anti-repressor protein